MIKAAFEEIAEAPTLGRQLRIHPWWLRTVSTFNRPRLAALIVTSTPPQSSQSHTSMSDVRPRKHDRQDAVADLLGTGPLRAAATGRIGL